MRYVFIIRVHLPLHRNRRTQMDSHALFWCKWGGFLLILTKAGLANLFRVKEGEQHMQIILAAGRDPRWLLTLHFQRDPNPPAPKRCQVCHSCWKLSSLHFELTYSLFLTNMGKKRQFNIYQQPVVLLETVENVQELVLRRNEAVPQRMLEAFSPSYSSLSKA